MEEFSNSRVIILDTDIRIFKDLSRTIQNWGLVAEIFTQPRAAVEYVDEKGCDVVLLDVLMPETCSPDLIPQFGKDLKVIVTTDSAHREAALRTLKAGAFDLLDKPFEKELLRHSILRALTVLATERQTQRLMDELEQNRREISARQRRLEAVSSQLFETNKALSVLARNVERGREEMESQIALRLRNLLMPAVKKLRSDPDLQKYEAQLNMLTWHLEDLTSGFSIDYGIAMTLSASEMRIASLVKNGVSTREIARQLHVSENTVRSHRRSIRKKLKINGHYNLRNFLDSRSSPRRGYGSDKSAYVN